MRMQKLTYRLIITAAELLGLNGKLFPFDFIENPAIEVSRAGTKTFVKSLKTGEAIALNPDDYFSLDPNGKIELIHGSSFYRNPWQQILAKTRLHMQIMEAGTAEMLITKGKNAIYFNNGKEYFVTGNNRVVAKGDVVIVRDNKDDFINFILIQGKITKNTEGEKITTTKNREALQWFENFLKNEGFELHESGAFEAYREDEKKEREIRLKIAEQEQRKAIEDEFRKLSQKIYSTEKPVTVKVGERKFTVSNGKLYRGETMGGRKPDLRTLFDNGILRKITNQLRPAQNGNQSCAMN